MSASRHARRSSVRSLPNVLAAATVAVSGVAMGEPPEYVSVPAGPLRSVLAGDADKEPAAVEAFSMRSVPVTQGEFAAFVVAHPQWRRDRVARTFADTGYLGDWASPAPLLDQEAQRRPVVNVSWFAAQAFCESEKARLPTWNEWEYVAASDSSRADARSDPRWLAQILGWYATSAGRERASVGGAADFYGVRDMHGLIWEWVDDFNALLVNPDSRSGDDPDKLKFCGAGAINLQDRQNYAVLMRIALLSSLNASDSTTSLGFRCVRPDNKDQP